MKLYRAGSGCPDALLRVPRPAASSLTYAEHPRNPIPATWYSSAKVKFSTSQQQGGGVRCSEVKEESKGGSLWTGDMSEDGHAHPAAGPEEDLGALSTGQPRYHNEFQHSLTE